MAVTNVLVIDDEKENVRYLTTILEENGFTEIHSAFDGDEGLEKAKEVNPGLILLDLRMPKKNGIHVFNELKNSPQYQDIPIIILTGEGEFLKHLAELRAYHDDKEENLEGVPTKEVLDRFITARPEAFLEKPIEPEALISNIKKILDTPEEARQRRWAELTALRDRKLSDNVVFRGKPFSLDDRSRGLLTALAARLAVEGAALPDSFIWRTADNQNMSMKKEDVLAFHAAVTDRVYELYKTSWSHQAQIEALTIIEEIETYDIQKDWPDNQLEK